MGGFSYINLSRETACRIGARRCFARDAPLYPLLRFKVLSVVSLTHIQVNPPPSLSLQPCLLIVPPPCFHFLQITNSRRTLAAFIPSPLSIRWLHLASPRLSLPGHMSAALLKSRADKPGLCVHVYTCACM